MNRSQVLNVTVAMVTLPARVVSNSFSQIRVTQAQKLEGHSPESCPSIGDQYLATAGEGHTHG
jgi:hypothetical protein